MSGTHTPILDKSKSIEKLDLEVIANTKPLKESFCLETCSLSYKDNEDYQSLVGSLIALKQQRNRAIKNMNILLDIEKDAMNDPTTFLSRIQEGQDIGFPEREELMALPLIDWEYYEKEVEKVTKHNTHRSKRIKPEPIVEAPEPETVKSYVPDKANPSFNRLWTTEEQIHLEELLVTFPSESVESKRYAKIAEQLPNRTKQQVASRVQKYFKKLVKNGLPVPGRRPKNMPSEYKSKHKRRSRFHSNLPLLKSMYGTGSQSTFLASVEPTVYMKEDLLEREYAYTSHLHTDAERDNTSSSVRAATCSNSVAKRGPRSSAQLDPARKLRLQLANEDAHLGSDIMNTPEYRQLQQLKNMRLKKFNEKELTTSNQHLGYQCNNCLMEPIVGNRYHCNECAEEICVDLCSTCVTSTFRSNEHIASHTFNCISTPETYRENDTSGQFSYLDPNFMPGIN